MRLRFRDCFVVAVLGGPAGCADPCFDDGLNQGGCPSDDASATATGGASQTETNSQGSLDATATEPTAGTLSGGGFTCPELDEVLVPQIPTFQLVVDQSGSMDDPFGGTTRWDAMRDTLIDPMNGVVTELQSQIRFGLSLYSDGNECPTVNELLPQLDAADEITTILEMEQPAGETPTGESLVLITETLSKDDWDGSKFIVLATDGEPDLCSLPDPQSDAELAMVRGAAVDAVTAAFDMGIKTFVISVGDDVGADHLQELANAGEGVMAGDPDAMFYEALEPQQLTDAFQAILNGVRDCEFALPGELKPEVVASCDVTVNDDPIPLEDTNGWRLVDETTIELMGDACDKIQSGVVVVKLNCTCEPQ